jgi:tetratricopeptide (TPR) repeat protein
VLGAAWRRFPGDFWVNHELGWSSWSGDRFERPEEAVRFLTGAVAGRPGSSVAHYGLGVALYAGGQMEEAIGAYRQALALDPKLAQAHTNLGVALHAKGQLDEAIAAHRRAILVDPTYAGAHTNLGLALYSRGQLKEAVAAHRQAVRLRPTFAEAHTNLGNALRANGQVDEAIAAHGRAIALEPQFAEAHTNLGLALYDKGQFGEAIAAHRRAIRLDPKLAQAPYNLGLALAARGQWDEASRAHRQAIRLDPKDGKSHGALGQALLRQGKFAEAQAATRRCLDLLPPNHPLRPFVTQQLRQCEHGLALEGRLPALLRGQAKPAGAAERLALAQLCQGHRQLYSASARFYAEAFAEQPRLAQNPQAGHRYDAACAAALAAGGHGKDAAKPDDQTRARLRRQALAWLRADLTAWALLAEKAAPQARQQARRRLRHWRQDPDLGGLRDKAELARLPEAERRACRELWAEVDALLRRAQPKPDQP